MEHSKNIMAFNHLKEKEHNATNNTEFKIVEDDKKIILRNINFGKAVHTGMVLYS